MGKKSVKLVLTILLVTGITVCCFRSDAVSTGMQIKTSEYSTQRCGRPEDTQIEETDGMKTEAVSKEEASFITSEKTALKAKPRKKSETDDMHQDEKSDMVLKVNIQNDNSIDSNTRKLKKSDAHEPQVEASIEQKAETYAEQKTEQHTEARTEQKTEQRTEARTEQKTEQRTEARTEQQTEQRTEERADRRTEEQTERRTGQRIEAQIEQQTEHRTEAQTEQRVEQRVEQTKETPKCSHNWVWKTHTETIHHDAVYEEYLICEAFDENVYETHIFCNNCGLDLTVNYGGSYTSEAADHMLNVCGGCGYHSDRAVVGTIHHDAEYGTKCTALAYDENQEVKDYEYCCICGARK